MTLEDAEADSVRHPTSGISIMVERLLWEHEAKVRFLHPRPLSGGSAVWSAYSLWKGGVVGSNPTLQTSYIGESSNGRTLDFESWNGGSIPPSPANF